MTLHSNSNTRVKPSDKQMLLDAENYEIFNRELIRKVFPRIIADIRKIKPRTKAGDIIPFYYALLSYVDGNYKRKDGTLNERFGYSFPSQDRLYEMTGIDRKRHPMLTAVLLENGLLIDTQKKCENMRHYIWYQPSFCPYISDDGYVINEDGERIIPDYTNVKF